MLDSGKCNANFIFQMVTMYEAIKSSLMQKVEE